MLTILLDCDGPLSQYYEAAIEWLYTQYPSMANANWRPDPRYWAIQSSLPPDRAHALHVASSAPGFCAALGIVPGAYEAVKHLLQYDLHVVTAPWRDSLTWAGERSRWLQRHFNFTADQITHTQAKHRVQGDILIDDRPETLDAWHRCHPRGVPLLWKAEWNQPHHEREGASNWPAMLLKIEEVKARCGL